MRLNRNFMILVVMCVSGCSQSSSNGSGTGGATSTGGASKPGSGGESGAGGSTAATSNSGGAVTVATGGAAGGGGSLGTGGAGSGGSGVAGQGTGGSAGGRAGSGGGPGGTTATGGNGASPGSGGGTAAGGTTGMGGGNADGGRPDSAAGETGPSGGTGGGGATGGDGTFVPDPGWACGMADGIPAPKQGTLAFSISLQISATHDVGETQYGHRRLLDVKGGTITGDKLKGSVLTGGLEYELTLSNGVVEYQGINILKTSDGSLIYVRSCGMSPDASSEPRVIPDFEAATSGSNSFLNTGKFVATRTLNATGGTGTLQLDVYDVSKVTAGDPRVKIAKPSGVPKQPWDCNTTTGTKGTSVFTENVSLGSSISISNAKRGSRNIIPITGGTTTGTKVVGAILNGGADYQLSGSLDAWYTLAPSDGEFILVRNCGPMGKLIPWFEARVAGPYNFLNTSAFLSSDPGGGTGGGVSITFYERK